MQLPDEFVIHFFDPEFDLFDRALFKMGTKIEIAFQSNEEEMATVASGEVTAITVDQGNRSGRELLVSGFDQTHRLHKSTVARTFANMTDSNVVRKIAAEHDLKADVDSTTPALEHLVQREQTDYEFLRERAEYVGFDLWVKNDTLYFKKSVDVAGSPPELAWNDNLLKFRLRMSAAEQADSTTVSGWHPTDKELVFSEISHNDLGAVSGEPAVTKDVRTDAKKAFGEAKRTSGHVPVDSPAQAKSLAISYQRKASSAQVIARGEALGDPQISAGNTVNITGIGDRLSGSYLLTSVEHVFGSDLAYTCRFVAGGYDPDSITDLMSSTINGSASAHVPQLWGGLVPAIVTNVRDPLNLGRVKVQFPTLSQTEESFWARLIAPGGGADRGFTAIPEVNDEVLVGFEFGDMERPIVLGGLWNSKDARPDVEINDSGEVKSRAWVSRSGHRILFVDSSPKDQPADPDEEIRIEFKDGTSFIKINKDGIEIKTGGLVKVESEKLVITTTDTAEVVATGDLILKGDKVSIEGKSEITVKAPRINLN